MGDWAIKLRFPNDISTHFAGHLPPTNDAFRRSFGILAAPHFLFTVTTMSCFSFKTFTVAAAFMLAAFCAAAPSTSLPAREVALVKRADLMKPLSQILQEATESLAPIRDNLLRITNHESTTKRDANAPKLRFRDLEYPRSEPSDLEDPDSETECDISDDFSEPVVPDEEISGAGGDLPGLDHSSDKLPGDLDHAPSANGTADATHSDDLDVEDVIEDIKKVLRSTISDIRDLLVKPIDGVVDGVSELITVRDLAKLLGVILTIIFTIIRAILDAFQTVKTDIIPHILEIGSLLANLVGLVVSVADGIISRLFAELLPSISSIIRLIKDLDMEDLLDALGLNFF